VDGAPVTPSTLRRYRGLFGYVPQFIYLSDDSVAQNVAFGIPKDDVDMDAVERACREAQIADLIERELPGGYHTHVGERGIRLSGGQRQRIGIARALYANPQVLVFDEATSALDMHTEAAVYQALENVARERTVVTIAHRLDTIMQADEVLLLEAGVAVAVGDVERVIERFRGG
jgi:ATP-binding cassette subfamily C protein